MGSLFPKLFVRRGSILAMILATITVLASCQSAPPRALAKGDQTNPWIVTIKFQGSSKCKIESVTAESNSCGFADPTDICVVQNKFLEWQSDPNSVGFDIYFDPIKGGPKYTAPNGKKKVRIDATVPPGMYKYSILGRHNACDPDTDALDPRIRVDK